MKKGLSQIILFFVSLLLIGATSWAADPVMTAPAPASTTTRKPALLKPTGTTPSPATTAPAPASTTTRKPVPLKPAAITPSKSLASQPKLPLSYVEVAAYPGVSPIRVIAIGLPSVNISNIRAFRESGGRVTGIDMRLVQGLHGQRIIETIVRADAVAGRYGLEFFANGKWTALQGGIMGLTVVAPQSGLTPLGAIKGLVDARSGLAGSPGLAGGPGSQTNPKDVGTPFGLPGVTTSTKPDLSGGSRSLGKPNLMEGGDPTTTTTTGGPSTADIEGKVVGNSDTTTSTTVASTDNINSDGSTDANQTIVTTSSDGTTMVDQMSAHIDADGNSTESQNVTVYSSSGDVIASSTSTGHNSTPDPEKAGCGSDQGCLNAMKWANENLFPIIRKMQDTFYMAKIGSLGGDRAADDPGGRPKGAIRSAEGLPKPVDGAVDPNPESGGSSGSSPIGALSPTTTTTKDLKGTLPDPVEGGTVQKAGPTLAPPTKPYGLSPSGSGEVGVPGQGPGPYPSMKK